MFDPLNKLGGCLLVFKSDATTGSTLSIVLAPAGVLMEAKGAATRGEERGDRNPIALT